MASLLSVPLRTPALSTLLGALPPPLPQWYYVDNRFTRMFENMQYTSAQIEDYKTKLAGLESCLNAKYWPNKSASDITMVVIGSWLKNTPVRTCSDIDLIYLLPHSVRDRYASRVGNIQSDLLQEIKQTLLTSRYYRTDVKGDGPTVVVDFSTVKVEIAPAFLDSTGSRVISDWNFKTFVCHTKENGRYGLTAPIAEAKYMAQVNEANKGLVVALMKMLKLWKKQCSVPIKTMALQMMAERFVKTWVHREAQYFWPDWLVRDFFSYMILQKGKLDAFPLTQEVLEFGDAWLNRAETAAANSKKACDYEERSYNTLAGEQWQKIFGTMIPKEAQ
jgi:hypothetical protein